METIIDKLINKVQISDYELGKLITCNDKAANKYLSQKADETRQFHYGNKVFIRGLIEFTNHCKNNCYYCGIRCSNSPVSRYRLSEEEILNCCKEGYDLGFRTFVLQGGEDPSWNNDRLAGLVSRIRISFKDCAITLSAGEKTKSEYRQLFDAGADRYLLRHETADANHYRRLHPSNLSWENRINCLHNLKEIGFQTGCGFMVGSPFQTTDHLIKDLRFIKNFEPHMVGIGPFLPATGTPFENEPGGSVDLTVRLLSIIRLMVPKVLLPATTALGTASLDGRQRGIMSGANVIMPNLSPMYVRKKYMLYNNKIATGQEAAESLKLLKESMKSIGYEIVTDRGDYRK